MFDGLSVAGFVGDKTYLLILQDNSEMRGTGGLISVIGVLTIHDGQITSLKYYYSHTSPELQTIVPLDGPESFTSSFGVNAAKLFDSNVQYDLASFAPKMQSDWYTVTGQKVDGVIVLDFTAVEAIMDDNGPDRGVRRGHNESERRRSLGIRLCDRRASADRRFIGADL